MSWKFLMNTKILCALCVVLIISCQSKYERAMLGGHVDKVNYKETIAFDFTTGLPLIEVKIQGRNYNFLYDTGAPVVLSRELADRLRYKTLKSVDMNDSQGGRKKQTSVLLDSITIGDIVFEDMAAVIIDYNQVFELSCFNIDGIIGSNLLSKAVWEIDYDNSKMSFSDRRESFDIPKDAYRLSFREKHSQKTPVVKLKVDDITYNKVTFDTGATGAFGLVVGKAQTIVDSLALFEMRGSHSVGVYGDGGESVVQYGRVDTIKMGDFELYDQLVEFESKGSITLGNRFLQGYRVLIDWGAKEILLVENSGYDKRDFVSFGFVPKFGDNKMWVGGIIAGSEAEKAGIQLNTQLLKINDWDLRYTSDSLGCHFVTSKAIKALDSVDVTFMKDSVEMTISLVKQDLSKLKVKP